MPRTDEPLPIDLDGIEMRWASQWNESDDGEVRAWRADVAALIDEVHRLRRVSNRYFEEMVRRTPSSEQETGLDVERLARAIDRVEKGIAVAYPHVTETSRQKAELLARAYTDDTDSREQTE